MSSTKKGQDILANAESDLRRLIAEAAERGDYSSVQELAVWAKTLRELPRRPISGNDAEHQAIHQPGNGSSAVRRTAKKPTKGAAKKASRRGGYPKFVRSGDALVKIAWSKSQKSEYKHKSPRSVASVLAATLDRRFSESDVVSMDSVLPIKGEDGSEVPDYQAYLCLAWLKFIGAVGQKGREGYVNIGPPSGLADAVMEAWTRLPEDK